MEEIFVSAIKDTFVGRKQSETPLDGRFSHALHSASVADHFNATINKKWRQAKIEDIERIHYYQNVQAQEIFGPVDLKMLLTFSLYSIAYENIIGEIVGFLCLNTYPNIPALLPEDWMYWLKTHYAFTPINYENTYFIHYLIWDMKYNTDLFINEFEQLFLDNHILEHICIVIPPKTSISSDYEQLFEKVFHRILPVRNSGQESSQYLYIYNRSDILPTFRLRKAIPEDNDDLMAILNNTHPEFREIYGEYYIAKTLLKKDKHTCIIVANIGVQVKGLIWLNSSIDVDKINKNYNIFPYHGLRKDGPNKKIVEKKYMDIMRKYLKNYFQNISASGEDYRLDLDEIINDEDMQEPDDLDPAVYSVDSWDEFFLKKHIANWMPSRLGNQVDWVEIKEKMTYYSDCYKYGERSVKETENPPSVFAIQLIALHPDLDERLAYQLLVAAFDAFPNKSYCLLSMETGKPSPPILKYFAKVSPRPECAFKECVYIIHKNIIRGRTTVNRIKGSDLKEIKSLLNYGTYHEIQPAREMMFLIRHSLISRETMYHALAVKNENTIIGIIILTIAENINLFRKYYNLDDYASYKYLYLPQLHGKILYLYVNPIIEALTLSIFAAIYRITGFHSLYYTLKEPALLNPYNTLLNKMYPIRPRRVWEDSKDKSDKLRPCVLFYQNINLTKEIRINVDLKLLFVGFTRATKAFLEKNMQKLRFTNLNVIAPPGVFEADYANMKIRTHLLSMRPKYTQDYLARLGFMIWVNFLSGYMKNINRKEKRIILENGVLLTYDYLFLFENVEFGIPSEVPKEEVTQPLNFQSVNTNFDCHCLHYKIIAIKKCLNKDLSIIVYGNVLKAFACVNYLLQSGIPAQHIHLVTDIPRKGESRTGLYEFGDEFVANRVFEELKKTKINIYRGYKFEKWIRDDNGLIQQICFISKFKAMWLDCTFIVCYIRKKLSRSLFEVLRNAGLVIEGCTVIDSDFRTSDPHIFSCGPGTKYKRSLYANKYIHTYYNHHEVAEYLAKRTVERVVAKIDRVMKPYAHQAKLSKPCNTAVPIFQKPIIQSISLPGGLFFTCLKEPGPRLPIRVREIYGFNDKDLITFSTSGPDYLESYCRVHLDKHGFIRDILCLTKRMENLDFIYRLYGLHESLLCNMKAKYVAGEIEDFIEFFRKSRIITIGDDRLHKLLNNTKPVEEGALHLIPKMHTLLQQIAEGKKRNLTEAEKNSIKSIINNNLSHLIEINFLHHISKEEEKYHMLATSEIVKNELLRYGIHQDNNMK